MNYHQEPLKVGLWTQSMSLKRTPTTRFSLLRPDVCDPRARHFGPVQGRNDPHRDGTAVRSAPVLVLNWNGWNDTFDCLRSIASSGETCEIWLVDNHSDIDRSDEARAIFPGLRFFRWDDNHGWAGGYNRALRVATEEGCEFAYVLNNDCAVERGFLSHALDLALRDPGVAAVGSVILHAGLPGFVHFDGTYHEPPIPIGGPTSCHLSVTDVNGAGMLIRLGAVDQCGGFDEQYFCYCEERDWCRRVVRAGWTLKVAYASRVVHRIGQSDRDDNRLYYLTRNRYLIFQYTKAPERYLQRLIYVYLLTRRVCELRRLGEDTSVAAITDALWHACIGRYGRRGPAAPWIVGVVLIRLWPFRAGAFRDAYARALLRVHSSAFNSDKTTAD